MMSTPSHSPNLDIAVFTQFIHKVQRMGSWHQALPISKAFGSLLMMASLSLWNGRFLVFLSAGEWQDPSEILTYGLTAFGGAGCCIAAMQLQGTLLQRAAQVIGAYVLVGIGALLEATAQPLCTSLLPANFNLFTGLFLIGVGIRMSDVPVLQAMTRRLGLEAATKIMLLLACVQGFSVDVNWQFDLDVRILPALCAALAVGCGLTLAAMALGLMMQSGTQQRALQLGAAITLCAVGIKGLGVELPQIVVLGPFFCGCIGSLSAVLLPHLASLINSLRHTAGAIGHYASIMTPASDLPTLATYLTRNDIVTSN